MVSGSATVPGAVAAILAALCCLACACGTARTTTRRITTEHARTPPAWSIVALGDSVPRGTNCDCRPFPELTGDDLAERTGRPATVANDSVGGATSADVLAQLKDDQKVIDHVRAANAIEIEIGANDVGYSKSCGTKVECYAPKVPAIEDNLTAIVARVHELTSGHRATVVLLDYWNVWLGGKYAEAKGSAYVAAAEEMTDRVDSIVKSTAEATESDYVDLRAAFKGPDYSYDETHFLSNDGDHPNAAGHEQIAKAVEATLDRAVG